MGESKGCRRGVPRLEVRGGDAAKAVAQRFPVRGKFARADILFRLLASLP
jgi:hypothetical protein